MANKYKINFNDYSFIDEEGTFYGTIAFKMYGKKKNILVYINLDNGRKVIAAAYQEPDNYLGLKELDVESYVEASFKKSRSEMIRLNKITLASM